MKIIAAILGFFDRSTEVQILWIGDEPDGTTACVGINGPMTTAMRQHYEQCFGITNIREVAVGEWGLKVAFPNGNKAAENGPGLA